MPLSCFLYVRLWLHQPCRAKVVWFSEGRRRQQPQTCFFPGHTESGLTPTYSCKPRTYLYPFILDTPWLVSGAFCSLWKVTWDLFLRQSFFTKSSHDVERKHDIGGSSSPTSPSSPSSSFGSLMIWRIFKSQTTLEVLGVFDQSFSPGTMDKSISLHFSSTVPRGGREDLGTSAEVSLLSKHQAIYKEPRNLCETSVLYF